MRLQITFDAADPHALAEFWAEALGYEVEDNSAFVDGLVAEGRMPASDRITRNGRSEFADVAAAGDPHGEEPRMFFQKVPEPKTAKNRVHIDIRVPDDRKAAEVARLESLGATQLWVTDDRGPLTYTMRDPEGNEFCLH
ncbi:VOC family protein [Humibacter sp. RRB41]|uniref:VOC family protein n=1 Tax=Humibacter sp. RRB41 TaxID=2919946 RepID=UPI001FA9E01B|nr:VOC family protein [Humibacter sp. RRB41]